MLPRNVIALVERPKDAGSDDADAPAEDAPDTEPTAKSWTLAEVGKFREAVRDHRLFACWLLSCYGLRRSKCSACVGAQSISTPAHCRSGGPGRRRRLRR